MTKNLKSQALKSVFWVGIQTIGEQGIRFIIGILLARILLPEDFGLIAMIYLFILLSGAFVDSGFTAYLVQNKNSSYLDECSVFYFNIIVAIISYACVYSIAPAIATFYGIQSLTDLLRALAFVIIFDAFSNVHVALLNRKMEFRIQAKIGLGAGVLSGTIGIVAAYNGMGVWAIIYQLISFSIVKNILLWKLHEWTPSFQFSFSSIKRMFSFGSKLLTSGILEIIFNNIYVIVIGKLFSAIDLGYYSRARGLQEIPVSTLYRIVGKVSFPMFSKIQDEKPRAKRAARITVKSLAFLNFPMMLGIAAVANSLIIVLLTEKWLQSVQYLQILSIVGFFYPLSGINLVLIKAQGRTDIFLWLEIVKKILVIISVALTYKYGIIAMLYGAVATSVISYFINGYYGGKQIGYGLLEQFKDIMPMAFTSIITAATVWQIQYVVNCSHLCLLVIQIAVGICTYWLLSYIFMRDVLHEFINHSRQILGAKHA